MKNSLLKILATIFAIALCLGVFIACNGEQTPPHTHDYLTLKSNESSHWLECECGDKINIEYHRGGTATETQKAVCEVCFKEYGPLLPHTHNFTSIKNDAETHWNECACGAKDGVEIHKGGTATCTELAKCEVCNEEYGSLEIHKYLTYSYNNDATCTANGTETAYCEFGCGESNTRTKTNSKLPHQYNTLKYNETEHWNECVCGDKINIENHKGGTATCSKLAKCEVCSKEHGSLENHKYLTYSYNNDATCTANGTETAYCEFACGESDTRVKENSIQHEYTILKNDSEHHWKECECGDKNNIEEHEDDRGRCECGMYYDYSEYLTFERITETDKRSYRGLEDGYKITCFDAYEYDSPVHIEIPAYYQGDEDESPLPVLLIDKYVFSPSKNQGLSAIESIKFNENLTHFGSSCFSNTALSEVIIPDSVIYVGIGSFSGCQDLKKVVFGAGVTILLDYTFSGCTKLEEVIFGPNHKEIKQRDFYSCSSLKSMVLPASVVSIPEDSIAAHGVEHALYEALAGLENIYLEITEEELLARTIPRAKRDQKTGNRWYEGYDRQGKWVSGYFNIYNFKYVLYADTTYGLVEGWNGTAKLHYKGTWHYDNDGKPVAN